MIRALLLSLLLVSTSLAQITIEKKLVVEGVKDPTIVGDKLVLPADCKLVIKDGIRVAIDKNYKFSDVLITKDGVVLDQPLVDSELLLTDPGKYNVNVVLFDPEKGIKRGQADLVIGTSPTPAPGPTPPGPTPPGPDEKIDNVAVLMIYESNDLLRYTVSQRTVLQSTDLRTFLNTTLSRDVSGQPNWRNLDKDVTFPTTCDTVFCKWMATLDKSKLPMLVIGNKDKIVFQGELPPEVETVKALVNKYKK